MLLRHQPLQQVTAQRARRRVCPDHLRTGSRARAPVLKSVAKPLSRDLARRERVEGRAEEGPGGGAVEMPAEERRGAVGHEDGRVAASPREVPSEVGRVRAVEARPVREPLPPAVVDAARGRPRRRRRLGPRRRDEPALRGGEEDAVGVDDDARRRGERVPSPESLKPNISLRLQSFGLILGSVLISTRDLKV